MSAQVLLVATRNPGKLGELRNLLVGLPYSVQDLTSFPSIQPVAEVGATFAENASLKARGYALQARLLTLADDSGLEVDALGGSPGVFSARYAGDDASDAERTAKLMRELERVCAEHRRGRFVSAVAVANQDGAIIHTATGICEGTIAKEPRGKQGFGYDPVFIPDGFHETFGQLSSDVKNRISHRARALAQTHDFLRFLTESSSGG